MAKFFWFDSNGQKQGPITEQELRHLTSRGIITPETLLETDAGHKGLAGELHGCALKFNTAVEPSPFGTHSRRQSANLFSPTVVRVAVVLVIGGIIGTIVWTTMTGTTSDHGILDTIVSMFMSIREAVGGGR